MLIFFFYFYIIFFIKFNNIILSCNILDVIQNGFIFIIYEFAKKGYGVGLLSPVTLYLHAKEFHHGQQKAQSEENGGDRFYTFPVRNNIPPNITSLVFRSDLTAPLFLQDFIRDTQAVFRTYARTVTRSFSVNS